MNILSQIINFDTTNFFKSNFILQIKNAFKVFVENIFTDFTPYKYISSFLNLQKNMNKTIRNLIVEFIHTIDSNFKTSPNRKNYYYINKSNVPRTIYTIYGEITFYRTLYKSKKSNEYYFYVDTVLGIEKYNLYDSIVRGISISDSVNNNPNNSSYHSSLASLDILNSISSSNVPIISRQSIYRWIRSFNIPTINYDPIDNGSTLYVMADEKWIHKQDKNDSKNKKWIMSKCFITFTGIKTKGKRSKLIGKHIFITTSNFPYKELMDDICKIYDFDKIETINLLSDAGSWILSGKDELILYSHNKVIVNTCEFHVKQKINRTTTDNDLREKLSKIIYEDEDKKSFIKEMDKIIESKEKQSRKDKITEYKNYIIKHWKGIISMKYSNIKSSMESHISHCIASKFGSRPKAYSDKYIQRYLKLQEVSLNEINILDLYLKSQFREEEYTYNEKEVDFSIFDKSTSNLPIVCSSNPFSIQLNSIAYPKDF